jgi:hypothetical protein
MTRERIEVLPERRLIEARAHENDRPVGQIFRELPPVGALPAVAAPPRHLRRRERDPRRRIVDVAVQTDYV